MIKNLTQFGKNYGNIGVNDNILIKELNFEEECWEKVSKECKNFISHCLIKEKDERLSAE